MNGLHLLGGAVQPNPMPSRPQQGDLRPSQLPTALRLAPLRGVATSLRVPARSASGHQYAIASFCGPGSWHPSDEQIRIETD